MGLVFCSLFHLLTDIPALIPGKRKTRATLQGWVDLGAAQMQQHYVTLKGHVAHIG